MEPYDGGTGAGPDSAGLPDPTAPEPAELPGAADAVLPVAELHLHLEGTLEPELVFALAGRNGIALPYADPGGPGAGYHFTGRQSFLDLYYANLAVLQTAQDFADMTRAYLSRAALAGVRHAEVMFEPQAHLGRGVPLAACVDGVASVLATSWEDFGISTLLIAAFRRDLPEESALAVLEQLLAMEAPIVGISLESADAGHPPAAFGRLFARARAAGLRCTAHAGGEDPPSSIREALEVLGAERIGHGVRCLEDPELVERLVSGLTPLTVCPLSDVRLGAVEALAGHPLPAMLAAGLNVSVNSDSPAYFGGYVDDNFARLKTVMGLSEFDCVRMAAHSIHSSFASEERKAEMLAELAASGH